MATEPRHICNRTVCNNEARHRHRDTGELYCTPCARKINAACNDDMLVPINPPAPEAMRKLREKARRLLTGRVATRTSNEGLMPDCLGFWTHSIDGSDFDCEYDDIDAGCEDCLCNYYETGGEIDPRTGKRISDSVREQLDADKPCGTCGGTRYVNLDPDSKIPHTDAADYGICPDCRDEVSKAEKG